MCCSLVGAAMQQDAMKGLWRMIVEGNSESQMTYKKNTAMSKARISTRL